MCRLPPIALFAYNRPDHLTRCLSALADATLAQKSDVLVFSDGPRNSSDAQAVASVREILGFKRWGHAFHSFHTVPAQHNLGLATSILTGVTRTLRSRPSVVVLEDDLIVASDFLRFMYDCLHFFHDDLTIGSISGYCPLAEVPSGYQHDLLAVPRICSHGWGTWADRWDTVDWTGGAASRIWEDPILRARFNCAGSDQLYRLRRQMCGQISTWAILFQLWLILSDRLTIYPVQNRVMNIGFDGSGVHTRARDKPYTSIAVEPIPYRLARPLVSDEINALFYKAYSGSWLGQLKRNLLTWRPPGFPAPRAQ